MLLHVEGLEHVYLDLTSCQFLPLGFMIEGLCMRKKTSISVCALLARLLVKNFRAIEQID